MIIYFYLHIHFFIYGKDKLIKKYLFLFDSP